MPGRWSAKGRVVVMTRCMVMIYRAMILVIQAVAFEEGDTSAAFSKVETFAAQPNVQPTFRIRHITYRLRMRMWNRKEAGSY